MLHGASQVSWLLPYRELFAANVEGTRQGLQFAADSRAASVHHISSLGTALIRPFDNARMVDEVLRRYGRLDILVNNAGAPQGADRNEIEDVPVAAWDLTMGVNARGCFLMSRAAVPVMRRAGWGKALRQSFHVVW